MLWLSRQILELVHTQVEILWISTKTKLFDNIFEMPIDEIEDILKKFNKDEEIIESKLAIR